MTTFTLSHPSLFVPHKSLFVITTNVFTLSVGIPGIGLDVIETSLWSA